MSKIFDFDARRGSLIDQVSKTQGTLTKGNGGFKQTEKGLVLDCDGNTTNLIFQPITISNGHSIFLHIKPTYLANNPTFIGTNVGHNYVRFDSSGKLRVYDSTTNTILFDYIFNINKVYFIEIRLNGSIIELYVNNKFIENKVWSASYVIVFDRLAGGYITRFFKGYLGKVLIISNVSQQERNNLYQDFLNSKPTVEPKRNFQLPVVTDLSNEQGLVAAYIPSYKTVVGGQLLDLSGNGRHVTVNEALLNKDGMKFDGVDDYCKFLELYVGLDTLVEFSISFTFRSTSYSEQVILAGIGNLARNVLINNGQIELSGSNIKTTNSYSDGLWHNVIVLNSGVYYIDGTIASTTTGSNTGTSFWSFIGCKNYLGYTSFFNGEIQDLKIYNYAFTPQQAKAYHNSFQQVYLRDTFKDTPVGNFPKDWVRVSGTAEVQERTTAIPELGLNIGDKYLKQLTAGISAIPSKQAYGEWEFDVYRSVSTYIQMDFIAAENSLRSSGYELQFRYDTGQIVFYKTTAGGTTLLFSTAAGYHLSTTWYRLKIVRLASEGVFKDIGNNVKYPAYTFAVFIKGGSFGTDKWTLVNRAGSLGSNPVTDATYTTSEYFVADLDAGDEISNIKLLNQHNQ